MVDVQSSASAPSFDAASATAMAATLRMIIDKHGTGLLANHRKLFGLLRDYAPGEPRAIRVLMSAFDLGIAERLSAAQAMTPDALEGEARSLAADTGLRDDLARWAVDVWAQARPSLVALSSGPIMPPTLPQAVDVAGQSAGGTDLTWGSIPVSPPELPSAVTVEASTPPSAMPEPPPISPVPMSAPEPASLTWGSEPHPTSPPEPAAPPPAPSVAPVVPPAAIEPKPVMAAPPPPAVPVAPAVAPIAAASLTWGSEPQVPAAAPPPAVPPTAPSAAPQPPLAIAPSVPPIAPNAPVVPPAPASLTWGSDPQSPPGSPPMAPSALPPQPAASGAAGSTNVVWWKNPKVGAIFGIVCSIIYFGANYLGRHPFDAPAPTEPARPAADPVAPPKPAPVAPVAPAQPSDPGLAVVGSTSTNPNDWPDIGGARIDGDKSTWKYEINIKMPDGHFYIYEVSVKMTGTDAGVGVVRAVEWSKRAGDVSLISVASKPIVTRFFSNSSKSYHTSVSTQTWDRNPTNAPPLCFAFNSGTTKQRFQPDGGYVCASPMNGADCVDVPIGCGHFK